MKNDTQNRSRREFEKWTLDYIQRQYPFYSATTVKEMAVFNRAPAGSLRDAWQAATSLAEQRILAMLDSPECVEKVANDIADIYGRLPDGSMYQSCTEYAKAALSAIKAMVGK